MSVFLTSDKRSVSELRRAVTSRLGAAAAASRAARPRRLRSARDVLHNDNMAVISVRVEKSGRVLIPVAVRRQLGLKEGASDLLLNIDETPIGVSTRAQGLARAREILSKYHKPGDDWTSELITERREEARREDGA